MVKMTISDLQVVIKVKIIVNILKRHDYKLPDYQISNLINLIKQQINNPSHFGRKSILEGIF